jgi:hypothetical protein
MRAALLLAILSACGRVDFTTTPDAGPRLPALAQRNFVKAANPDAGDFFGTAIALSADGSTLAVGARWEDSGGSPADNSVTDSGATYVYVRAGASWVQQAYIKVAQSGAEFGSDVRLSATGDTLVVTATMANKAYVFQRSGSTWTLQAPLSPPAAGAYFGSDAAISDDGNTVVIGEYGRAGNTGAAHVFTRTGTTWSGPLTLTASNADAGDIFGDELAMSGDGTLLVVGAKWEQSSATSIDGDATDNSLLHAGAAYVFRRNGSAWSPEAYLKASDTTTENWFGSSLAVNRDGSRLVVAAGGANMFRGAAYVFDHTTAGWQQTARLQPAIADANDETMWCVALSDDGRVLVSGGRGEASGATGVNGDALDNSVFGAGAAYVFVDDGGWAQFAYLKSFQVGATDNFGASVDVAGSTIVVGATGEATKAAGLDPSPDELAVGAGAAYVFE